MRVWSATTTKWRCTHMYWHLDVRGCDAKNGRNSPFAFLTYIFLCKATQKCISFLQERDKKFMLALDSLKLRDMEAGFMSRRHMFAFVLFNEIKIALYFSRQNTKCRSRFCHLTSFLFFHICRKETRSSCCHWTVWSCETWRPVSCPGGTCSPSTYVLITCFHESWIFYL